MSSIDILKNKVRKLYNTHPDVHVNVSVNNPRVRLTNEPAVIRGVYPHVFTIEMKTQGKQTLQYTDLLMGNIEIVELNSKAV